MAKGDEDKGPGLLGIKVEVDRRLKAAADKHDWSGYDEAQVFEAVAGEFDEYREAVAAGQVSGRHGQVDELFDLVVTAIRGIRRLAQC